MHSKIPDVLRDRKCMHIQLRREVHAGLREKCFRLGMSMQEVIDELARLIAVDDKRVMKLLDEYAARKLSDEINRLSKARSAEKIPELDQNSLYDLINERSK